MVEIILTADRTLMSEFRGNYWLGFFPCMPKDVLPNFIHSFFNNKVRMSKDGIVERAPIGLRKVEAVLNKLKKKAVVVSPDKVSNFIKNDTKVVGVTVMDPLGISPAAFTAKIIFNKLTSHTYSSFEFERLMNRLKVLKKRYKFKILVGGCGAWQLVSESLMKKFGIDYIFQGEIEETLPKVIEDVENGSFENKIINGEIVDPEKIIPITKPSINNVVEISRGCGRGCFFCTETKKGKMRYVPMETIVKEAKANVSRTPAYLLLQSENFLEYGSKDFYPDENVIMELYKTLYSIKGVKEVWPIHVNLASIAANPELVMKLTKFLRKKGLKFYSCQPGLETGSGRLINLLMRGKILPFKSEEWEFIVKESFKIMDECRWIPFTSIIMGLPGENEEDIKETITLVKSLDKYDCLFTPLFFRKMLEKENNDTSFNLKLNLELFKICWKHNLRKIPTLLHIGDITFLTKATLYYIFRVMKVCLQSGLIAKILENMLTANTILTF